MTSLTVTIVFAAALLLKLGLELWLIGRQVRHVARHREALPPAFAGVVSLEAHRKALVALIDGLERRGKRLAIVSAPAKGMTLLNYCRLGPERLKASAQILRTSFAVSTRTASQP